MPRTLPTLLVLALMATACGGEACPEGSVSSEGRCVPLDAGALGDG